MNKLAADVKLLVIVRRDGQRKRPDKSILQIRRRRAVRLIRPHFDVARLAVAQIETFDNAADAARTGSARPDDVWIDRIGRGPTALAAADWLPRAARNLITARPPPPRLGPRYDGSSCSLP